MSFFLALLEPISGKNTHLSEALFIGVSCSSSIFHNIILFCQIRGILPLFFYFCPRQPHAKWRTSPPGLNAWGFMGHYQTYQDIANRTARTMIRKAIHAPCSIVSGIPFFVLGFLIFIVSLSTLMAFSFLFFIFALVSIMLANRTKPVLLIWFRL